MKELSIKEKAKAYDLAIEAARCIYNNMKEGNNFSGMEDLEVIFPELVESEDEGIRKALVEHIKDIYKGSCTEEMCKERDMFLAWLEKQDSHYTFEIKKGHWYKCVCDYMLNGSDLIFKNNRLYYCRRDWRLGGEIDEQNVKDIGVNGYKSFFRPATNQEIKDWLEKQGEQKSTVEGPKFKAGNWIIFNGLILHIDEIVNGYYRTTSIGGIHNSYDWDIDNIARRWTITDAKDGDVLSYRDGQWIFIYKEIVTEDTFKYYALLSEKGITVNDAAFSLLTSCIIPATKEQSDLLFAKTKEAGYTFDFEKKELKKIGKKSAWSEKDETGLTNTIIMLKEGASLHFNIKDIAKAVNWLKSLKDRVRIQPQPKQEWNALDERNLQGVIDEIQANKNNAPDYDLPTYDRFLNWLKSLKDRVQPQLL